MTFSEASSTGLLDRQDFQWHAGLLSRLGLEPAALPALCDTHEVYKGSIVAEYRKRWPELAGIAWARGVGEPAAFHVGVGCAGQARQQGRPRVCVHLGNTAASIRVCTPSKDAPQQHAPGDVNDKAGLRAGAVSASLCHFVVQRDVVLVGSTLADGGSIYAWGTQQLAGTTVDSVAAARTLACIALVSPRHCASCVRGVKDVRGHGRPDPRAILPTSRWLDKGCIKKH